MAFFLLIRLSLRGFSMKSPIERKLRFPRPDFRFNAVQPELRSVQGGGFPAAPRVWHETHVWSACQVRARGPHGDRGGGRFDPCSLTEEPAPRGRLAPGGGAPLCGVTGTGLQKAAEIHGCGAESRAPSACPWLSRNASCRGVPLRSQHHRPPAHLPAGPAPAHPSFRVPSVPAVCSQFWH